MWQGGAEGTHARDRLDQRTALVLRRRDSRRRGCLSCPVMPAQHLGPNIRHLLLVAGSAT